MGTGIVIVLGTVGAVAVAVGICLLVAALVPLMEWVQDRTEQRLRGR